MKFAKIFKVFKNENFGKNNFIWLEEFIQFLKSKDENINVYNIKRTLNGLQTLDNKIGVPVGGIIKYVFKNRETYISCKLICEVIEEQISETTDSSYSQSSFELYKKIAKTKFFNSEYQLEDIKFEENKLKFLINEHKPHFSPCEWQKICWFERHFEKDIDNDYDLEYNSLIELKFSKFQNILTAKQVSENVVSLSKSLIKEKCRRIDAANLKNTVELCAQKRHLPSVIECELLTLLQRYCGDNVDSIICFDTINSESTNSIQLVISLFSFELDFELKYLCESAFHSVHRKHCVNIEHIYIVNTDTLQSYCDQDNYSRFLLRDDIDLKKLQGIDFEWNARDHIDESEHFDTSSNYQRCQRCFDQTLMKPLAAQSFDILSEWYVETPIEVQLLLEQFINKSSLSKTKSKDEFLKQKFEKLYRVYDILLNIQNKNYIGIHQKASTDELLVEYKSVNSVFNVTASAGLTTSLRFAENKLKTNTTEDLCYYNTFIKQHALLYKTVSGSECEIVSLRKCHVILMLDNLVRLRYTAEPNPGECRSKQICTLPITLQGLPLDAEITSTWHDDTCDGSNMCHCKRPKILNKEDINSTLIQADKKQDKVLKQFQKLMTWGTRLWDKLTDEILLHIESDETIRDSRKSDHSVYTDQTGATIDDSDGFISTETDDDIDLEEVLQDLDFDELEEIEDIVHSNVSNLNSHENDSCLSDLEMSIDQLSILDVDESVVKHEEIQALLSSFGFTKFVVPPLLCRHPPPAIGKDDDIYKIKEILDDTLKKMGYLSNPTMALNRILCGPDNKIGKCVMNLIDMDDRYQAFLPEFPLLHLRKSNITIIFSAYKDAGLVQILKFMRNDNLDDWKKLASAQHIDTATRHVRRLALSLHLALLVVFSRSLPPDQRECFLHDMESEQPNIVADNWSTELEAFMLRSSEKNATFALHIDMMRHCDNVVAIHLAERLGGPEGYALLLATVKDSIRYLFVNNATSYAPFCAKLLYHHYSAGFYHKCLKETLFSTPFKSSTRNYACDTKREIDHIDALKGFRSGSNISSVTCRMSLIDSLNEVKEQRQRHTKNASQYAVDDDTLGWDITETDKAHILPTVELILRKGGLSTNENHTPANVYTPVAIRLPPSILYINSNPAGEFFLLRYLKNEKMFKMDKEELPVAEISGPKELVSRAVKSKGVTIKRAIKSKIAIVRTETQLIESERIKAVAKETKRIDCFSSANNACQSLVKPDSSKPKVMKSVGMQRALRNLLTTCLEHRSPTHEIVSSDELIILNAPRIPQSVSKKVSVCAI